MKKIFFKKNKKELKKGFTLVEALISITILMISVAAPLSLAAKGLTAASLAKKQIVAFYLAQDATEAIINIKTGNKIDFSGILNGLEDCDIAVSTHGCAIDTLTPGSSIEQCSNPDCGTKGRLYKTPSGLYRKSASLGDFSGFVRQIKIKKIETGAVVEEAQIETTVWWKSPTNEVQKYVLTTNIANW